METSLVSSFLLFAMNPRMQMGVAVGLLEQTIHEGQVLADYLPDIDRPDSYSNAFNSLVFAVSSRLDVSERRAQRIASRVINDREINRLSSKSFVEQSRGYNIISKLSPHDPRRDLTTLVHQELHQWPAVLAA